MFAVWIVNRSLGCPNTNGTASKQCIEAFSNKLLDMTALNDVNQLAVSLLLAILLMVSGIVQLFSVIFRQSMLFVLVGTLPLAAAASTTEQGRAWWHKSLGWLLAFVAYKPAAAIIYATAFSQFSTNDGKDLMSQLYGVALLILAAFTLPALMRFVAPVVDQGGGGGGGGAGGMMAKVATGAIALKTGGASTAGRAAAAGAAKGGKSNGPSGGQTAGGGSPQGGGPSKSPGGGSPGGSSPSGGAAGGTGGTPGGSSPSGGAAGGSSAPASAGSSGAGSSGGQVPRPASPSGGTGASTPPAGSGDSGSKPPVQRPPQSSKPSSWSGPRGSN
jgi:type IV secretion system protein TrbL